MARPAMEDEMADYFTIDDKQLASACRDEAERCGYRFGQRRVRRARGAFALHLATSHLKALIRSIADAKVRRMLREIELGGTRQDMRGELWTPDTLRDRGLPKQEVA